MFIIEIVVGVGVVLECSILQGVLNIFKSSPVCKKVAKMLETPQYSAVYSSL